MDIFSLFSNPATAVFAVGAIAIVVTGVVALVKMFFSHKERVEMIRSGMHPDAHTDENAET